MHRGTWLRGSCRQGIGTDDETLIRLVVTRCEIDMVEIKQAFMANFHKTLGKMISVRSMGFCQAH